MSHNYGLRRKGEDNLFSSLQERTSKLKDTLRSSRKRTDELRRYFHNQLPRDDLQDLPQPSSVPLRKYNDVAKDLCPQTPPQHINLQQKPYLNSIVVVN